MAFNLINTPVLNSLKTSADFGKYSGLSTTKLNLLGEAGVLTPAQISTIKSNSVLPTGLPKESADAATAAGLTATQDAVTADINGPDITVMARDRSDQTDNRLRLSALKGREDKVYGPNNKSDNILAPLYATGGMMFPYTPSIQIAGDTDWTPHALTHTNYDIYSYQRTPSATVNLSGKFTVQNQREGEYALACIHFLRTVGKMYYGEQDSSDYNGGTAAADATSTGSSAGLPPPVLRLRGYGLYMFQDLKCVLKGYSFNFEENMDLVTVKSQAGGDIMLPPMFTITISLLLQQNGSNLRKEFKLDDFRTGSLMRQSTVGGWF